MPINETLITTLMSKGRNKHKFSLNQLHPFRVDGPDDHCPNLFNLELDQNNNNSSAHFFESKKDSFTFKPYYDNNLKASFLPETEDFFKEIDKWLQYSLIFLENLENEKKKENVLNPFDNLSKIAQQQWILQYDHIPFYINFIKEKYIEEQERMLEKDNK
jgi:hypothetical protein